MNRLTALSSRVAILLFGTVVAAVSIAIIAITTVGYASVHSELYVKVRTKTRLAIKSWLKAKTMVVKSKNSTGRRQVREVRAAGRPGPASGTQYLCCTLNRWTLSENPSYWAHLIQFFSPSNPRFFFRAARHSTRSTRPTSVLIPYLGGTA